MVKGGFMYYTRKELSRIDGEGPTITIHVSDFNGNQTKHLGVNTLEACEALIAFTTKRKNFLKRILGYED